MSALKIIITSLLALAFLAGVSCRDQSKSGPSRQAPQRSSSAIDYSNFEEVPELPSAKLIATGLDRPAIGAVEKLAVTSKKIAWTPLSPALLKKAQEQNRPVLLICVTPELHSFDLFQKLDSNSEFTSLLQRDFIPAVVDVRFFPELAHECDLNVIHLNDAATAYPMFFALSPSGIPLLVNSLSEDNLGKPLNALVYTLSEIAADWEVRRKFYEQDALKMRYRRIEKNRQTLFGGTGTEIAPMTARLSYGIIGRLEAVDLKDSLKEFSAPLLVANALFDISANPDFSQTLRTRAQNQALRLGSYLAFSGPYLGQVGCYADGAFFKGIALPRPSFSIRTQFQAIHMLLRLYETSGDDSYLQQATAVDSWINDHLKTNQGFASSLSSAKPMAERFSICLFTYQQLSEWLDAGQLDLLAATAKVRPEGNLETSQLEFQGLNTIQAQAGPSASAAAAQLALPDYLAQRKEIHEILRSKADLDLRSSGIADIESTAIYATIQLELFAATAKESYLQNALQIYTELISTYREPDGSFRRVVLPEDSFQIPATSRDLVSLARLAFLLHSVHEGPEQLQLAQALISEIASRSEDLPYLLELRPEQQLVQLTAPNLVALDGDSSISGLSSLQKALAAANGHAKSTAPIELTYSDFIIHRSGFGARVLSGLCRYNAAIITRTPESIQEKARLLRFVFNGKAPLSIDSSTPRPPFLDDQTLEKIQQGQSFLHHKGQLTPADSQNHVID